METLLIIVIGTCVGFIGGIFVGYYSGRDSIIERNNQQSTITPTHEDAIKILEVMKENARTEILKIRNEIRKINSLIEKEKSKLEDN